VVLNVTISIGEHRERENSRETKERGTPRERHKERESENK